MANEVQATYSSGATLAFIVHNSIGQAWNNIGSVFESFSSGSYAQYLVSMTEQSTLGYYTGSMPVAIIAGAYNIVAYQQIGGSPAITDPAIASGQLQWSGTAEIPFSALASSGQIANISPIKMARGVMVQNIPIYLVGSQNGVTPFTSGILSGSILRDGGSFGALQSGLFTETGMGWYNLLALTSGDLLANTAALMITANGVSGGSAVPRAFSFILQRTSGSP